jgi:hypothetical protein
LVLVVLDNLHQTIKLETMVQILPHLVKLQLVVVVVVLGKLV